MIKVSELVQMLEKFEQDKNVSICGIPDIKIVDTKECVWIDEKNYIEESGELYE